MNRGEHVIIRCETSVDRSDRHSSNIIDITVHNRYVDICISMYVVLEI